MAKNRYLTEAAQRIINSCVEAEINRLSAEITELIKRPNKTDEEVLKLVQAASLKSRLSMAQSELYAIQVEE